MKLKLLLFLSLAVMAAPAFAGPLIFQLNPSLGYGAPGGPAIIFFGTLQYLNIVPDMNDPAFEMDLNDISVTFTPLGSGSMIGTVYVKDTAVPPTQMIPLSGTGTQPKVSLSTAYVAFGNQKVGTSSAPQTVTMTNTGTATWKAGVVKLAPIPRDQPQRFPQTATPSSRARV